MGTEQSAEFRQEAVRVALTSGLARKQVAADFGIHCQAGYVYMPEMGVFNIEPVGSAGSEDFARTVCPVWSGKRSSPAAKGKPATS